jgi:hypothetical protein
VSLLKKIILAAVTIAPAKMFACATCYGSNVDSSMTDGMNWAILTLGAILTPVLGGFLAFLIYVIRRSEALTAAVEQKNSPEPAKT